VTIANAAVSSEALWSANWAWGLPLIVATLVIHVFGLFLIGANAERFLNGVGKRNNYAIVFAAIVGGASLSATLLLGIEGIIWAAAYRLVCALPDASSAVLYSLNALTAYGHENLSLERHWELMGALEALNGTLLFGLTTAFLFGVIRRVWDSKNQNRADARV
jgi:hypothetical protein